MSNLAGKAGAGIGPVVSRICKQEQKNLLSFAIMPFKFEKERIFQSGVALKRIRQDSECCMRMRHLIALKDLCCMYMVQITFQLEF